MVRRSGIAGFGTASGPSVRLPRFVREVDFFGQFIDESEFFTVTLHRQRRALRPVARLPRRALRRAALLVSQCNQLVLITRHALLPRPSRHSICCIRKSTGIWVSVSSPVSTPSSCKTNSARLMGDFRVRYASVYLGGPLRGEALLASLAFAKRSGCTFALQFTPSLVRPSVKIVQLERNRQTESAKWFLKSRCSSMKHSGPQRPMSPSANGGNQTLVKFRRTRTCLFVRVIELKPSFKPLSRTKSFGAIDINQALLIDEDLHAIDSKA